jgi:two-component system, NarL family, nitrate/nitrite response regulator NarL
VTNVRRPTGETTPFDSVPPRRPLPENWCAMGEALSIVVADQHAVFAEALAAALTQGGHRVVATTMTRCQMADAVGRLQPQICVTGNVFPDGYTVELIGDLAALSPDTKIVLLTADADPETLSRALNAGAAGYVHKSRSLSVLSDVRRRCARDEIVVEGSFARARAATKHAPPQLLRLATYLTQREVECLTLLAEGLDTTTMARRLGVSPTTVRSHVQAVLTKLGVHSRLEAASLAIRFGLIDQPQSGRGGPVAARR